MRVVLTSLLVLANGAVGLAEDENPRLPHWVKSAEVRFRSGHHGTFVGPSGRWVGVTNRHFEFRGVRRDSDGEPETFRGLMVLHGPLTLSRVARQDGEIYKWRFAGGPEESRTFFHVRRRAGTRATAWFVNEEDGVIEGVVSLECQLDFDAMPTRVGSRLVPTPVRIPRSPGNGLPSF